MLQHIVYGGGEGGGCRRGWKQACRTVCAIGCLFAYGAGDDRQALEQGRGQAHAAFCLLERHVGGWEDGAAGSGIEVG